MPPPQPSPGPQDSAVRTLPEDSKGVFILILFASSENLLVIKLWTFADSMTWAKVNQADLTCWHLQDFDVGHGRSTVDSDNQAYPCRNSSQETAPNHACGWHSSALKSRRSVEVLYLNASTLT